MKGLLWASFLLLSSFPLSAQILTHQGHLFSDNPFFSVRFITENHIRTIRGTKSQKRELRPIEQLGTFEEYSFDRQGRMTRQMETIKAFGGFPDTSIVLYEYYPDGMLYIKRLADANGFYSHRFEYDEAQRVTKTSYCRDENAGSGKNFVPGKQLVISSETMQYEVYHARQAKQKVFNNQDRLYKEVVINYDDFGNKREEVTTYVLSGRSTSVVYQYDENGRLIEKTDLSGLMGRNDLRNTYTYDSVGNVLEEKVYRNDELKTTIQFLYDETTMLLKAKLTKDEAANIIYIVQYETEFD